MVLSEDFALFLPVHGKEGVTDNAALEGKTVVRLHADLGVKTI